MIDRVERAMLEERFVLHAQPIVDLRSGRVVQHELLLRMREPDGDARGARASSSPSPSAMRWSARSTGG